MSVDIPSLVRADKTLAIVPTWANVNGQLVVVAPLDIDGVTVEGLQFRGCAFPEQPDRNVSLQLEFHPAIGHGEALIRIEWRPLRGHNNKGLGPSEHRYRVISGSHWHPFDLNWLVHEGRMRRNNLPVAAPLPADPANFRALLVLAGELFRINDLEKVPPPPWEPRLL